MPELILLEQAKHWSRRGHIECGIIHREKCNNGYQYYIEFEGAGVNESASWFLASSKKPHETQIFKSLTAAVKAMERGGFLMFWVLCTDKQSK